MLDESNVGQEFFLKKKDDLAKSIQAIFDWSLISDDVKKEFWNVFLKDTALNFLTEKDINFLLNDFELQKLYLMSKLKYSEYDENIAFFMQQLRNFFFLQIKRAVGVKGNINNERLTLAKSITERIETKEEQEKKFLK